MALRIHSILQSDPDPSFDTDIVLVGNFLGSGSFLKLDRDPDPSQTVRGQKSFPPFAPLFASFSAFLGGTILNTDQLLLYIRKFNSRLLLPSQVCFLKQNRFNQENNVAAFWIRFSKVWEYYGHNWFLARQEQLQTPKSQDALGGWLRPDTTI